MAELGKMNGIDMLWIGLDGRSDWSEENSTMAERQWITSSGQAVTEIKWKDSLPIEDATKQCVYLDTQSGQVIIYIISQAQFLMKKSRTECSSLESQIFLILRFLSNENCDEKRYFMCMTKSLDTPHEILCPKSFIRYKTECYYHSLEKGDYNKSEVLCASKGSRIIPIKDRATYQFLRSWSIKQNFGDFYLGKCNHF